ncbi:MAG: hypothetical protein SGPRY_009019 [Prymnesium sp.]
MALTQYELFRQANMAANKERLLSLGLGGGISKPTRALAKQPKISSSSRRTPAEPTRARSARLLGLSSALDSMEETYSGPLSDEEVQAAIQARDYLLMESSGGSRESRARGISHWGEKRALLREARDLFGLRWPSWLDKIQQALPPMGTTESARDQTMFAIERAACGLGLDYKAWPDGVGVLLANEEATPNQPRPRPRVLTLGSDTEMLKREGQRLEHRFGRDAGNGWAYNHALGKVRQYQEKLLREELHPSEVPAACSVREMEEGGQENSTTVL